MICSHHQVDRRGALTIAIGIKCSDGVLLACDSQSEFERGVDVKRLNQTKIYETGGAYLYAGSGITYQVRILVNNVGLQIDYETRQKGSRLSKDETESTVEQVLLSLVKHYNIDRSAILEMDDQDFFDPQVMFAGFDRDYGFYLDLLHGGGGVVEELDESVAIGSGAAYAELLFHSLFYSGITIDEAIPIAAYIIEEVKAIDPHCGGDTRIAFLAGDTNKKGQRDIKKGSCAYFVQTDTISQNIIRVKPSLDLIRGHCIPMILRGELDEDTIRSLTKNAKH